MCSGLMFVFINIILQNFLWNKLVRYATATHIQRMKSVESFYVNGKLEKILFLTAIVQQSFLFQC